MSYWVEVRSSVKRNGKPRLVPLEEVSCLTGFRSVYAYDDKIAEQIREMGSTLGLRGSPVFSNVLLVDFDNTPADDLVQYLRSNGIAFELYHSGGRSEHLHISIVPMYGPEVPYSQKEWIKKHAPTADISFYHPGGQFRLPRTFHEKNPGHRKELIAVYEGKLLSIPTTVRKIHAIKLEDASAEDYSRLLITPAAEGHRRPGLWLRATMAAELGIHFEDAVAHLLEWNNSYSNPPHQADVIYKQVQSAFIRTGRLYGEAECQMA